VPGAEAVEDQLGASELVKVHFLQDPVVADGQQYVLLELVTMLSNFFLVFATDSPK
jgi:hypothetical protein